MSSRASVLSLIVFAVCLVAGTAAQNSFGTTIQRALVAMVGTLVVGLIVGAMAQKMLDENLKTEEERLKKQSEGAGDDR